MPKTPRKLLTLFGEYIVEFNFLEYQCKTFLADFIEETALAHILIMHQPIEFILKRIQVVYKAIIENDKLIKRWNTMSPKIKKFQEIRNDIAHSYCDVNPEDKNEFLLTRFSETQTLNLSQREILYTRSELKKNISDLKKLNIQMKHLYRSTFVAHTGAVFVKAK